VFVFFFLLKSHYPRDEKVRVVAPRNTASRCLSVALPGRYETSLNSTATEHGNRVAHSRMFATSDQPAHRFR
uniref:Uncharacterized protein n=1 Tax=Anopheles albimanus TaxID=7167 RepID=A0A182FZ02_ANOAL